MNLTQQDIDHADAVWRVQLAEINKRFNPNHDDKGKFTSGDGGNESVNAGDKGKSSIDNSWELSNPDLNEDQGAANARGPLKDMVEQGLAHIETVGFGDIATLGHPLASREEKYKQAFKNGEKFPMIEGYRDREGVVHIVDGHHRAAAWMSLGYLKIPIVITSDFSKERSLRFNPNHLPAGPGGGQFAPSDGGSGSTADDQAKQIEDVTKQVEVDYQAKILAQETHIRAVAKALGVSEDRVKFIPEERSFTVGGQQFKEAANADLITGELTFRIPQIDNLPGESLRGLTVHEVQHLKFEASQKAYLEEKGKLHDLEGKIYSDTMNGNPKAMPMDAYNRPEYPTHVSGALKEEFKGQFPLVARFEPTIGGEHYMEMINKDGVSDYSKAYWVGNKTGNIPTESAFHETVAEIARVKMTDPGEYKKVDPLWKDFVTAVDQTAKERGF